MLKIPTETGFVSCFLSYFWFLDNLQLLVYFKEMEIHNFLHIHHNIMMGFLISYKTQIRFFLLHSTNNTKNRSGNQFFQSF